MEALDMKLDLISKFVDTIKDIPDRYKESLKRFGQIYTENNSFLNTLYRAFIEGDKIVEDAENNVRYEKDGEDYFLVVDDFECTFSKEEYKKILVGFIDILEDTLPLGSVVDLKKDAYKDNPNIEKIEHLRMVVIYRFLGPDDEKFYFPYAGVVYPTGMLGRKEVLYFTRNLVDKVVRRGFSDENEEAYVYLMKNELVIEKGRCSIGYGTEEEIKEYNKKHFKKGE